MSPEEAQRTLGRSQATAHEGKAAEQGSPEGKRGAPRATEKKKRWGAGEGGAAEVVWQAFCRAPRNSDLCRGNTHRQGTRRAGWKELTKY